MSPTKRLLLGTNNANKVGEMRSILHGLDIEVLTPHDLGIEAAPLEDGLSFEANALIKAHFFAELGGEFCLADDSGLEVDALDGRPGVFSSRYAPTDKARINRLLRELKDTPPEERGARFVCAMALTAPPEDNDHPAGKSSRIHSISVVEKGVCEGRICGSPAGSNGFGYDPVFFIPERGKTMAELSADEKNLVSHRARALAAMRPHLMRLFG
jgi:XTP/dITP diphosphohydrolase